MQEILHITIIAVPVAFATFMILDLIANLKQLWIACKPSAPVSIPASTQPLLPEVTAPAAEHKELELTPDPWSLEPPTEIAVTSRLTIVPTNLLLLPPAKIAPIATKKAGHPKKEATPVEVQQPIAKRRGRPKKTA